MIGCVVISDRGDLYLPGCLDSLKEHCPSVCEQTVVIDDSEHKYGMAGAVRTAWAWALDAGYDYLLHWEEDFRALEPPDIDGMIYILEHSPLAQVVLKRQPWSVEECAAGGIIEMHPESYTEYKAWGRSLCWTEHSRIFSLNPCLIPRKILELGWPGDNEAGMTRRCLDAGYRFAFYGGRNEPPRVEHVGAIRAAGYRL